MDVSVAGLREASGRLRAYNAVQSAETVGFSETITLKLFNSENTENLPQSKNRLASVTEREILLPINR